MRLVLVDALRGLLPDGLAFGLTPEAVVARIGPAPLVAPRSRRDARPGILKYGDIELHFADGWLWLIFADTFEVPRGAGGLVVDPGWLEAGLDPDAAKKHLILAGMQFTVGAAGQAADCVLRVPPSGELLFTAAREGSAAPSLEAISIFAPQERDSSDRGSHRA